MTHIARRAHNTLEPIHAMVYFVPEASAGYESLGLDVPTMGYFASRSAAFGPVPASVVVATFFNFNPALVASAIPSAWERATPGQVLDARRRGADEALRRLLGDAVGSQPMAEAAALARRAAEACTPQGRPLYAAHSELPWPDEPHLQLWHAATLLREFRGDGHIACLVEAGLGPVEALICHVASGAVGRKALQRSRAWSDDDWAAAEDRLRGRGWLDADGAFTFDGTAARDALEHRTDELAERLWAALGDDAERLIATCRGYSRTIFEAGTFPWLPRPRT